MSIRKHKYIIHFNKGSKAKELLYNYGKVNNISLRISNQRATISFETGSKYVAEDLISFKSNLFRDAYRKIYFLHALINNCGLDVRNIEVVIDGNNTFYDKDYPHFPFLFSMIEKKNLGLYDEWSELVPDVLSIPKSKMDDDLRFVAAFSYLAAGSKQYEVERFTDLWTSMNAYYSYIAFRYENELRNELGIQHNGGSLHASLKIQKNDSLSRGALCWILCPGRYQVKSRKEADELWKNNYKTERILCDFSESGIRDLYEASKEEIEGGAFPLQYDELASCAKLFGVPVYTYLLLIYPYHWRCNLFHGNRTTMLFSAYNDYEIAVLHTVNYFLKSFLNKAIPEMFTNDFFTSSYKSIKEYMRRVTRKPNGTNDFDKRFEMTLMEIEKNKRG